MIAHQVALLKRELWEHRGIWVAPVAVAVIVSLLTLTGQVSISAFGDAVDMAIIGASNVDEAHRRVMLMGAMSVVTFLFALQAAVVIVFYSLDSLYAERKDKSILFWRSLPITDAETVVSKLLTAVFVIPLITLAITFATHILMLIFWSIWVAAQGGNAGHLIWSAVPIADVWLSSLIFALAVPLWVSPFIGWFLFVSTFTKRSPLLMSFLPIFVLPMLERLLLGTHFFYDAIFERTFQPPLANFDLLNDFEEEVLRHGDSDRISMLDAIDLSGFLTSPGFWVGLVVCGLLTAAAIYMRRYRDDS